MTIDVDADTELKAKHRAMWGTGDYPRMVDTFLVAIGQRLVEGAGIGPGMRVLDVATGTGNAAVPAAPPPGAQPPPLWGSEEHLAGLFGNRVKFHTLERETLEITAFARARDYGEHLKAYYGPTIAVRANAAKEGRAEEFDQALDRFCDTWNLGVADQGRFEKEYLLAVGTRR